MVSSLPNPVLLEPSSYLHARLQINAAVTILETLRIYIYTVLRRRIKNCGESERRKLGLDILARLNELK